MLSEIISGTCFWRSKRKTTHWSYYNAQDSHFIAIGVFIALSITYDGIFCENFKLFLAPILAFLYTWPQLINHTMIKWIDDGNQAVGICDSKTCQGQKKETIFICWAVGISSDSRIK